MRKFIWDLADRMEAEALFEEALSRSAIDDGMADILRTEKRILLALI